MTIEPREEVVEGTAVTKGKRTKRPRAPSPIALTMACSSDERTISTSDNVSLSGSRIEEDMANCLILLSRGGSMGPTNKVSGFDSYQCKTCNRCFSSFQALGGHRTSHKKPSRPITTSSSLAGDDNDNNNNNKFLLSSPVTELRIGDYNIDDRSTELSLRVQKVSRKSPKVHECSICGAEFSSGQALGGHMRRHRLVVSAPPPMANIGSSVVGLTTSNIIHNNNISFEVREAKEANSSNINLNLDLNLPAPELDGECRYGGSLAMPREQVLVFAPSTSLVDCYY